MRLCATCQSSRQKSKVKTPTGITLVLDSYQYGRRWVSSSLGCIAKLLLVIHGGVPGRLTRAMSDSRLSQRRE